jgi:hypothetical protein
VLAAPGYKCGRIYICRLPPQVFEPRRFVELRKQSFWKQVKSAESFGMGLFYTLNVFFIQFYLGVRPLICPRCTADIITVVACASSLAVAFAFVGVRSVHTYRAALLTFVAQ